MSLGQSQATGIPNSVQARMRDIEKYSMGDLLVRALIGRDLIRWSDFVRALHDGTECPKQTIVSWVAFMDEHLPFLTALGIIDPRALDDTLQECGAHSLLRRQTYNVGTDPRQYEGTKDGEHLRLMRNHDLVVSLINGHGRLEIPDKKNLRDFLAKWVPLKRDRGRLYQLINLSDYDGSRDYSPTVFGDQVAELGFTRTQAKHRRLAYHLRQDLGMSLEEFLGLAATTPPRDESDDDIAGDFTGNDEPNHPELTEEVTRIPQTRQLEESLDEAGVERRTTPVVSQPARSPDPPLVELEDLGTLEPESEDFDDESDEEEVEEPAAEADEAPPEKSEEVPVEEPIIAFDVPVGDSRDMQEFFGEEGADLLGGDRDGPLLILLPGVEVPESEPPEGLEEELPRDDPYGGQRLVLDASLNLRVVEGPVEEPAEAADPGAEIPGEETSLVEPEERDHEDPPREPTEEILEDQATPITQAPVVMTGPTAEDQSAVTTRAAVSEARVTSQDKLPRAHAALERMLMILVAEYGWTHPRVLTGELLREVTQLVLGTTTRRPCDRLVMRLKRGRRIYALPVKKFGFRRGMSWYVRGLTEEVASGITDDQLRQCMRSAFERVSVAQILLDLATIPLDVLASAAELAVALPQGKVRKPARSRSKKMAVVLPPDEQTQRVHQALDRMLVLLTSVYEWPFPWVVTGEFIRPLVRYVLGDEYTQTRHYALLERMKADGRLISLDLNLGPRGRPWQVQPVTEVLPSGIADDQLKEFIAEGCAKHPLENLVAALRGVLPPEAASSENLPARRGSGEKTRESPDQSRRAAHNTQRGGSRGAVIPVPKLMLNKKEVRALIAQQERVLGQVEKALEQLQEAQVATRQLLEELYRQRG